MTFLTINHVEKFFGTNHVLRGFNLDVDEHEVICLIGASGSGKSTLLRCINGLEPIQGGSIEIDGIAVEQEQVRLNYLRRSVGIVFQSFNLFPHMTVLQNVTLAPRKVLMLSKQDAEARAIPWLERIGLAAKSDEYPDRLSGGQQQRVAIARALAMQPKLLLLDEVTSALDPELVGEVLSMVQELAAEGMTMLLATHEMGFARDCASRVAFLHQGTLLELGTPEDIFSRPKQEPTQQFLRRVLEAKRI